MSQNGKRIITYTYGLISQEIKAIRQLNHTENEAGKLVPELFCSLRKLYIRQKQVFSTQVIIRFGRPRLGHTIKTNCITFLTIDPDI